MKKILKWGFKPNSPLHTNSVLFKRDVFKKKLFDEHLVYEDLELWIDLLLKNVEFIYTPVVGIIVTGNKQKFNRLVKINQNPVSFIKNKIHIKSPWLLKLLFVAYGLKPRWKIHIVSVLAIVMVVKTTCFRIGVG